MLSPLYQYLQERAGISVKDFRLLEPFLEIRHFEKDTRLVETGAVENYVNFIKKGLIRKFFFCKKKQITTQLAKETELICSAISFLTDLPSEYIVETIEPSTIISISKKNLNKCYALGPRMERMGRMVITDWYLQKERWDTEWVILSPGKRFRKLVQENRDLITRVPQKFLASYLDMAPETFSRYKHAYINSQ